MCVSACVAAAVLAFGHPLSAQVAEAPPESPPVVRVGLVVRGAEVTLYHNRQPVALHEAAAPDGGPAQVADVTLEPGLNLLVAALKIAGPNLDVEPTVLYQSRRIGPERWAAGDTWRQSVPDPDALWPEGVEPRDAQAWAVFVGEPKPQLFPKLDTFHIPRASKQLVRPYIHMPGDVPSADYRMVVEAPAALRYVACDTLGSGKAPQVAEDHSAAFECDGTAMKRYHLYYDMLPGQGMELSIRWGDETGHTLAYQPTITAGGTFDWRHLSMEVTAPPGAVSAHPLIIKWQERGITGTFWVDNLVFRPAAYDNLLKMGTFDEPEWGSHWMLKPEGPDGSKCVEVVSTEENADKQQALWVDKEAVVPVEAGEEYVVELDVKCEQLGSPTAKPICGLLFEAPADMPTGDYPLFTYFETLRGRISELPVRSQVRVLPPLKDVRPKRARLCPCYYGSRFSDPEVARAYAENCWASGITWTYGGMGNDVVPFLLDRGHQVTLSIGWDPWSAPSAVADFLKEHPELQAVDFGGKRSERTFCPTWMLSDGQVALAALEEWLLGIVNAQPYPAADWDLEQPVIDPPTFCTCDRCLAAFREFAKLPADAELTPATLLEQYPAEWTRFRCTQNAEMAGHLKAILQKADRPVEFSMYSGYQSQKTQEHYGVDWSLLAPHLDMAVAGYGGTRDAIQATLDALGDVPFMGGEMWYLSDRDDERPPPRMETWRNRILRQSADSGGNGCLIWWLPPMDGGAFYATSEAAEIIARYEGFFRLDQRCDEEVQVEGVRPEDWMAFRKDGRTLVMLLNFTPDPLPATVRVADKTHAVEIAPYGVEIIVQE